jgi:hypothetical protein
MLFKRGFIKPDLFIKEDKVREVIFNPREDPQSPIQERGEEEEEDEEK